MAVLACGIGILHSTTTEAKTSSLRCQQVIEKHVVKGWRNVKGLYIKSPSSMAIPLWLADELWAEAENVDKGRRRWELWKYQQSRLKRKRNP